MTKNVPDLQRRAQNIKEARITALIKKYLKNDPGDLLWGNIRDEIVENGYELTDAQFSLTTSSVRGSRIAFLALDHGYELTQIVVDKYIGSNNLTTEAILAYAATNNGYKPTLEQTVRMLSRGQDGKEVKRNCGGGSVEKVSPNSRADVCHRFVAEGIRAGINLLPDERTILIETGAPSSYIALGLSIGNDKPLTQQQFEDLQAYLDVNQRNRRRPIISNVITMHCSAVSGNDIQFYQIPDDLIDSALNLNNSDAREELITKISSEGKKLSASQFDRILKHSVDSPEHGLIIDDLAITSFEHGIGFVPTQEQIDLWLSLGTVPAKRSVAYACSDSPYVPTPTQVEKVFNDVLYISGAVALKAITEGGFTLSDEQITQLANELYTGESEKPLFQLVNNGVPLPKTAVEALRQHAGSSDAIAILAINNEIPVTNTPSQSLPTLA